MTDQEILDILTRLLRDLMMNDAIILAPETRREDVPGWDSFNYINFIASIEIELGVKFRIADVESFENVGAIVAATRKMIS